MRLHTRRWTRVAGCVTLGLPLVVASVATAPVAQAAHAGIANGKIAFSTQAALFGGEDGQTFLRVVGDVWTADPDGGNRTNLTRPAGAEAESTFDYWPTWSPDGKRIAFTSDREGAAESIWVMAADGSAPARVTTPPEGAADGWPGWSPSGSHLVFTRDPDRQFRTQSLHRVAVDGSELTQLTSGGNDWHPRMSPDNTRLAFVAERPGAGAPADIYLTGAGGGTPTNLTATPGFAEFGPEWSPDGNRLAYTRCDLEYVNCDVWVMAADGTGATAVTTLADWENEPAWSPDGERIAFRKRLSGEDGPGSTEIRHVKLDGTDSVTVVSSTQTGSDVDHPDWQPVDSDGDGAMDRQDHFPNDPTETADTDGDGTGNNADTDDDGDGQSDADETACGSDPRLASSVSPDLDGDKRPDCADTDDDGDGVADAQDQCPRVVGTGADGCAPATGGGDTGGGDTGGGGGDTGGGGDPAPAPQPTTSPSPSPSPSPSSSPSPSPSPGLEQSVTGQIEQPGDRVATGTEVSAENPLVTGVTSQVPGTVSITQSRAEFDEDETDGVVHLELAVDITAPRAESADEPLVLEFLLDGSILPDGLDPDDLVVERNGVAVPTCTGPDGVAAPDPCAEVSAVAGGGIAVTVYTTRASRWTFAERVEQTPEPTPEPEPTQEPPPADFVACPSDVPAAGFSDVAADSVHRSAIDCAVHWQLTSGLTADRYGPERAVTRAQMAAFVARLVRAAGGELPTGGASAFIDTAGSTHEPDIAALSAAGIVQGTSATTFGPSREVTRAQMAAFLVRAHAHIAGQPPAPSRDWFADDAASVHQDAINRVRELGVTTGVTPTAFDPDGLVRRDQMASFLTRTLTRLAADGVVTSGPS